MDEKKLTREEWDAFFGELSFHRSDAIGPWTNARAARSGPRREKVQ